MSRLTRMFSIGTALVLALLLTLVTVPGAQAATRPVVTSVGPAVGPLRPSVVTIHGRNLSGATQVQFGSRRATIVKRISATAVEVRTPKGERAGTVKVRIRTAKGWSRRTASYTFVAPPTLTSVSKKSGPYGGGQSLTLRGRNLSLTKRVTVGAASATIVRRSARSVIVRTPVGVLGATTVRLVTPGGTSSTVRYTYVRPTSHSRHTITAAAGVYEPASVDWVTGGFDPGDQTSHPWVVGLPSGAAVPAIGRTFVLRPGHVVFPSGLAGTVSNVAVQADDSVRVTVSPSPLATTFKQFSIDYSGPAITPGNELRGQRRRAGLAQSVSFPIDSSALFCHDPHGGSVDFGADLALTVSDVDVSERLDAGSLFRRPSFDASLTAEVTITGKLHTEARSTCAPSVEWMDAHRRVFLLPGGDGATISFAPTFSIEVTAKSTLTITNRTRTTWAVKATLGKSPDFSSTSRTVESTLGGALSFEAVLSGGIEVQFGELDRAGVVADAALALTLTAEAADANVCLDGRLSLNLSVGLFVDVFVARWTSPTLHTSITLYSPPRACVLAEDAPPPVGEPQITSGRLPDAPIGSSYDETLQTADNREGGWSVVGSTLPAGLSLDPGSGEIAGTPTGPVGDDAITIDFTDSAGRVATSIVRIMVMPSLGIGGGDIQATLSWSGPADLDLHMIDPSGEEIYFGNRYSASGGELDQDANANCNGSGGDNPVENIFWPPHGAPAGGYDAFVRVYAVCDGPLDWHLTVRRNGVVIIDQTGNGDSPDFTFEIGGAAARRVALHHLAAAAYPQK